MNDWKARAEREAAAIVDQCRDNWSLRISRDDLITVVAMGWLQGAIVATHMDLQALEEGADATRAAL